MIERLQKLIARAGVASRRAAEELVTSGRVRVNGKIVTELGAKANGREDKIEVDGRPLLFEAPIYLVLHKPRGVVSTMSDPEGRPTVAELVKAAPARVYPVGRLDFATSGVLLMTNDGEFANGLLHPRGGVPKTYVLKVAGQMSEEDVEKWRTGVVLEDGKTLPAEIHHVRHEEDKTWLEVTLREGRNQQIRRMGEATGFRVMRLARLEFAGVTSERLRPGEWRPLSLDELLEIRKQFGVPKRVRSAAQPMSAPHDGGGRRPAPRGRLNAPAAPRDDRGGRPDRAERRPRDERAGTPAPRGERYASPKPRAERSGPPARGERSERNERAAGPPQRADRTGPPQRADRSGPPQRADRTGPPQRSDARPGAAPVKPARSDRSGTTPRAAGRPGSPARGRAGR